MSRTNANPAVATGGAQQINRSGKNRSTENSHFPDRKQDRDLDAVSRARSDLAIADALCAALEQGGGS